MSIGMTPQMMYVHCAACGGFCSVPMDELVFLCGFCGRKVPNDS